MLELVPATEAGVALWVRNSQVLSDWGQKLCLREEQVQQCLCSSGMAESAAAGAIGGPTRRLRSGCVWGRKRWMGCLWCGSKRNDSERSRDDRTARAAAWDLWRTVWHWLAKRAPHSVRLQDQLRVIRIDLHIREFTWSTRRVTSQPKTGSTQTHRPLGFRNVTTVARCRVPRHRARAPLPMGRPASCCSSVGLWGLPRWRARQPQSSCRSRSHARRAARWEAWRDAHCLSSDTRAVGSPARSAEPRVL